MAQLCHSAEWDAKLEGFDYLAKMMNMIGMTVCYVQVMGEHRDLS